jgi:hypothetical protein
MEGKSHMSQHNNVPTAAGLDMNLEVIVIPVSDVDRAKESALRRVEAAHGEHAKRGGGHRDENWPKWYAEYMVAEQSGAKLPT